MLDKINAAFVAQQPQFLYGLGQNSNSYAATLLWMVGIDLGGLLAAVTPTLVTGMDPLVAAITYPALVPDEVYDPFPGADRNILLDGYGLFPSIAFTDLALTDGNDTFRTGHGADSISGEAGDGHDEIRDWEDGVDMIGLSSTALTFASLTITATTAGHALVSIAAAHDILISNAAGTISAQDFVFAIT